MPLSSESTKDQLTRERIIELCCNVTEHLRCRIRKLRENKAAGGFLKDYTVPSIWSSWQKKPLKCHTLFCLDFLLENRWQKNKRFVQGFSMNSSFPALHLPFCTQFEQGILASCHSINLYQAHGREEKGTKYKQLVVLSCLLQVKGYGSLALSWLLRAKRYGSRS